MTTQSLNIGLDLDGVTYDLLAGLTKMMTSRGRCPSTLPTPKEFNFFQSWGLTATQFSNLMTEGLDTKELFWTDGLIPQAKQFAQWATSNGHRIHVITARSPIGPAADTATRHWIAENNIPVTTINVTDHNKETALLSNNVDVLIDDAVNNCEHAASLGIAAVNFAQTWNTQAEGIFPRTDSLEGLINEVKKVLFRS